MKSKTSLRPGVAAVVLAAFVMGSLCGCPSDQSQTGAELNILFQVKVRNQYDVVCLKTEGVYGDSVAVLPKDVVMPIWSPDYSQFIFSHQRGDHFDLAIADADGGNLRYLTADSADNVNIATFFPSGDSVVFATNRNGNLDIYSMRTDGTGLTPLVTDSSQDWHPIITPDGQRLLFISDRTGRPRIWALDFQKKVTVMTFPADSLTAEFEPCISPNGQYLAFSQAIKGESFDIVLYDLANNAARKITTDPAMDRYPRFSRDGTRVLFHSNRTGVNALYVYDIPAQTTRALNTGAVNSAYGDW